MIGIVLASHSQMAQGMIESCKMLMGESIENILAVSLLPGMSLDEFDDQLQTAIDKVNDGSGVIVLCDLFGGTPSNRSTIKMSENIRIISGMNLAVVLELLCKRNSANNIKEIDFSEVIEQSRNGLLDVNEYMRSILEVQK